MSTSYVSLQTGAEAAVIDGENKWRAVIKHSQLVWWSGEYEHATQYHAEEQAERRLHDFLDDLLNGEIES